MKLRLAVPVLVAALIGAAAAPAGAVTSTWTATKSLLPTSTFYPEWEQMSCPAPGTCVTVREAHLSNGKVTMNGESSAGGVWSQQTIPAPPNANPRYSPVVFEVDCAAPNLCFASGSYDVNGRSNTGRGFIATFDGSSWTTAAVPVPSGGDGESDLFGITCSGPSYCVSVGDYTLVNGGYQSPLVETWTGADWVATTGPALPGQHNNGLVHVGCVAGTTECAMTGFDDNSAPYLVAGSTATRAPLPADARGKAHFDDVSCAASCVVVGYYPLAKQHQAGVLETSQAGTTTWSAQKAPLPPNTRTSSYNELESVSCVDGGCVAVGSYDTRTGRHGLIETLTEAGWQGSQAPTPATTSYAVLDSVSCTAANSCTAVGYAQPNGLIATLSDGAWTAINAPVPAGARSPDPNIGLSVVDCATATDCAAAGSYYAQNDKQQGVLESES